MFTGGTIWILTHGHIDLTTLGMVAKHFVVLSLPLVKN